MRYLPETCKLLDMTEYNQPNALVFVRAIFALFRLSIVHGGGKPQLP